MGRRITVTIGKAVCGSLHLTVGGRCIGQFLRELVRPQVLSQNLDGSYRDMAADEVREREALAWSQGLMGDVSRPRAR